MDHSSPPTLLDVLREELVSGLHMGRLRAGDRLPSIRTLARERRIDHRMVARAYHALAGEGLVEIRGRSGVCIATQSGADGQADAAEWAHWIAGVMAEGWQRRLSYPKLASLLQLCSRASRLRCVCVESNRDQMVAYEAEIGAATHMTMVPVYVAPEDREEVHDEWRREVLRAALGTADLVVTTQYHATAVRSVMGATRVPLVALKINPALAAAVRQRIRSHGLTVVAASPEFGARLRLMYSDSIDQPEQLRVFVAGDSVVAGQLPAHEPILLTRAARELLPEVGNPCLVFPHSPTLAPESVAELTEIIVRLNLERG